MTDTLKTKSFGSAANETGGIITWGRTEPDQRVYRAYVKLTTRQLEFRLKKWTYFACFTVRRRDILGWEPDGEFSRSGVPGVQAIMRDTPTLVKVSI